MNITRQHLVNRLATTCVCVFTRVVEKVFRTCISVFLLGSLVSEDEHFTQSHRPEEEAQSSKEHIFSAYVLSYVWFSFLLSAEQNFIQDGQSFFVVRY